MEESADWLGLRGKACVVTGAARGIGAEIARSLARAGARVAALDRGPGSCAGLCEEIGEAGGVARAFDADVADAAGMKVVADAVMAAFGTVDVLVNNAAVIAPGDIIDVTPDDWERVMAVNVRGALISAQVFAPQMLARGKGAMVHVGSLAGVVAQPHSGAYSVSKAGLLMLSQLLALELGPRGIRSNSVSPAAVRTPLSAALYENAEVVRQRERMIPQGRIGEPRDIADTVAFLASDRAGYVNGQNIVVDGGYSVALMGLLPRPGFEASR